MKRRTHNSVMLGRARAQRKLRPARSIPARSQADQRLAATLAVSQILAASPALDEAIPAVLKTIGDTLRWHVGALWTLDSSKAGLHCDAFWCAAKIKVP